MNIPDTFYNELVDLQAQENTDGFIYPVILELNNEAQDVLTCKHQIPFPIPVYAVVRNGRLNGDGSRLEAQSGIQMQYSLFTVKDGRIKVCIKYNQERTFRILSRSDSFMLSGEGLWTTPNYFKRWKSKDEK